MLKELSLPDVNSNPRLFLTDEMRDLFFPGVSFEPMPLPIEPRPVYISLDDQPIVVDDNVSYNDAYLNLGATLRRLGSKLGTYFPIEGRHIHFVSQRQLQRTISQKDAEVYGSSIINEAVGTCKRNPDGTFYLQIAHQGNGHIANFFQTMSVAGHEYGHSFGPHLNNPLAEEMKALSFEALFMMEDFRLDSYIFEGYDPSQLHDVARDSVRQLLAQGFTHEGILANLLFQSFGGHRPVNRLF